MYIPPGDASVLTQFWVLWHEPPGNETEPPGDAQHGCCFIVLCENYDMWNFQLDSYASMIA